MANLGRGFGQLAGGILRQSEENKQFRRRLLQEQLKRQQTQQQFTNQLSLREADVGEGELGLRRERFVVEEELGRGNLGVRQGELGVKQTAASSDFLLGAGNLALGQRQLESKGTQDNRLKDLTTIQKLRENAFSNPALLTFLDELQTGIIDPGQLTDDPGQFVDASGFETSELPVGPLASTQPTAQPLQSTTHPDLGERLAGNLELPDNQDTGQPNNFQNLSRNRGLQQPNVFNLLNRLRLKPTNASEPTIFNTVTQSLDSLQQKSPGPPFRLTTTADIDTSPPPVNPQLTGASTLRGQPQTLSPRVDPRFSQDPSPEDVLSSQFPDAVTNTGRIVRDNETGDRFQSNGLRWERIN